MEKTGNQIAQSLLEQARKTCEKNNDHCELNLSAQNTECESDTTQNRPLYRFSTSKNLILKIYILYIVHKVIYIQRLIKLITHTQPML